MLNILHVISDTNIGGAGTHLASVVNSLNKDKFNVFVACPSGAQIISLIGKSVHIIEIPSMKGDSSFGFGSILSLVKVIIKNKINIVHTHASLSGRIAAKICNKKIVFTRHTPGPTYNKSSLKWTINKYLNDFLSHKIIAVSQFIESQLHSYGLNKNKIEVIYNGIDISSFKGQIDSIKAKSIYGISDETVILIVARLEEIKGHIYLLKAFYQLIRENYKLKLIIVGSGSKEDEIKEFVKSNSIEKNVVITGTIKDIKHVISISDIIVLPSLHEALGLALIEGMCMSKPCIASNVDGIPEVVSDGESGILVKPKDIESIKVALLKLIKNDDLRIKMGLEGNKIVHQKFNINTMIEKIENLYINM